MSDSDGNSGGLFGLDPQLLANLGLGLMAAGAKNSPMRGNMALGAQSGISNYYGQQEAQQKLGMGKLQMQQMQQEMPMRMSYLKQLGSSLFTANNSDEVTGHLQGLMGNGQAQAPQAPPPGAPQQGAPMPPPQMQAPQPPPQMPTGGLPQSSADPMSLMKLGAFGGALGMPGAQGLQELGKTQLQYDPATTTRMEAAKSSVAVDQQQIQDALGRGDTKMAQAIAQKMRQDLGLLHIASMSGTQTRIGLGGDISTFNPNEGVQSQNGIESAIPGAAAARGEIEGAIARGRATGETVELVDPKTGEKHLVPKSTIVGGSSPSAPVRAPGIPAVGGGNVAGLGPIPATMLKGNAEAALATNKDYQGQAEGAQQVVAQTQAILNSANDFTPGQFADSRAKFLSYLNSAGLINPTQAKALGSYQEGDKISIQLQAAATKMLGSREAAQIFSTMGKSIPNLTLSQDGLQKIGAWQLGMARYNMSRAQDANTKAQGNDATGVNQVRDTWIKNSNPLYYVAASAPGPVREEMLSGMKNRAEFVKQWQTAAKAGFAPRPGDYNGGP